MLTYVDKTVHFRSQVSSVSARMNSVLSRFTLLVVCVALLYDDAASAQGLHGVSSDISTTTIYYRNLY